MHVLFTRKLIRYVRLAASQFRLSSVTLVPATHRVEFFAVFLHHIVATVWLLCIQGVGLLKMAIFDLRWALFHLSITFYRKYYLISVIIMACHIVYGRPYCNDAKEGVGGITPQNSTEGNETQQGQITSKGTWCVKIWARSAQARRRGAGKRPSATPKNMIFFVDTTTHDLTHFLSADFHEIFARTRGSVSC